MRRLSLPDAVRRPLMFARVWEDPLLELEAFAPRADRTYVVVGSGGCTTLSLLAAGARQLVAVDLNPTQNDLGELKAALVRHCESEEAIAFLGHARATRGARRGVYRRLRGGLSRGARAHWDGRSGAIAAGVEHSGVTERGTRVLAALIRGLVHSRRRVEELLAQPTLAAQRAYYAREWNSARWRALLALLGDRRVFALAYPPARYHHHQRDGFAELYARNFEHAVTELPVANNYFLHQVLLGRYPAGVDGRPPYLDPAVTPRLRASLDGLAFVDGSYTAYLRTCPPGSIDGFALSNICEWMSPPEVDALFAEVTRTAAPGAVVCFRNNFGHTEVPARWRDVVIEDRARSTAMGRRDRSIVTPRFAVCTVEAAAARSALAG